MAPSLVSGEIDRISGSGNAMLRAKSGEYNLGPLPEDVVGDPVVAVELNGPWAVCLTPYKDRDDYFSELGSTTNIDREDIVTAIAVGVTQESVQRAVQDLEQQSAQDLDHDRIHEVLPSVGDDFEVGDTLDAEITIGGVGGSYVFLSDGVFIEVEASYLPAGTETAIEISETDGAYLKATLSESVLERAPDPETVLTVEVRETDASHAYSILDGVPIFIPDCPVTVGEEVTTTVDLVEQKGIETSIDALPADTIPSVGSVIDLEVHLPSNRSTKSIVRDGLPIEIFQPMLPLSGTLPFEVAEIRRNSIVARIDFPSLSGLSEGTRIIIEDLERKGNNLVARYEQAPVCIPTGGALPTSPESLPVSVTDIRSDRVVASIRSRPEITSLDIGSAISVSIDERIDDILVADYHGVPVWVPFDGDRTPLNLMVGVTEITDVGITASLPGLPDSAVPSTGDVVFAEVEAVYPDSISASIGSSAEEESYWLPVSIPLSVDVSGEVGVEIVEREDSRFTGILRTQVTDDGEVNPVSTYLQEGQQAFLSLREQRFSEAATAWKAAAGATKSDVRRAEALRSWAYAVEEATRKIEDGDDSPNGHFEKLFEELDSLEIPDSYRSLIHTEVEFYQELASIQEDEIPASVEGLQRIAYTVDIRGQVGTAAGRLRSSLQDLGIEDDIDWAPFVPHPLVTHRLNQVSAEFDSSPEIAQPLLRKALPLESLHWPVPPTSSPEPVPDKRTEGQVFRPDFSANPESTTDNPKSESESATNEASTEKTTSDPAPPVSDDGDFEDANAEVEENNRSPSSGDSAMDGSIETGVESEPTKPTQSDDIGESVAEENTDEPETRVADRVLPRSTRRLRRLRLEAEASASTNPVKDTSMTGGGSRYTRAPAIKEYVKSRADGVCEACSEPAPFKTTEGDPYLETHHIDELGKGGKDHPDKVVAICPTCHKRIHYGQHGEELNEELRALLEHGLADVGSN